MDYKKAIKYIRKSIQENIYTELGEGYLNYILYCYNTDMTVNYSEMFKFALSDNNDKYLKRISSILENGGNVIVYNSLSEITMEHLNSMSDDTIVNIRNIKCFADSNLCADFYTISDLRKIIMRCNEILFDIDRNQCEEDIFMQIYLKLGKMLKIYSPVVENDKYVNSELNNLIILVEKKGFCRGFSIALKNLLDIVGIECVILTSKIDCYGNGHAYNQVKIDGKWYYCDLTYDSTYIVGWCLKSETEYRRLSGLQTSYSTPKYKSDEDYTNIVSLSKKNYLKMFKKDLLVEIKKIQENGCILECNQEKDVNNQFKK